MSFTQGFVEILIIAISAQALQKSKDSQARQLQCNATWRNAMTKMKENPDQDEFRSLSGLDGGGKKDLFIHIGKAGGETINMYLHKSNASFSEVHVHPVLPRVLHQHRQVIICVRDPVQRILSAFNYEYHRKIWFEEVMSCFQNMEQMLQTAMITKRATARCQAVAQNVLTEPGHGGHVSLGYCFYIGGLIDALRSHQVFLVHTESIVADLHAAGRWLGLQSTPKIEHWTGGASRGGTHDLKLSASSTAFLTSFLAEEYMIVRQLEEIAENGDPGRYSGRL